MLARIFIQHEKLPLNSSMNYFIILNNSIVFYSYSRTLLFHTFVPSCHCALLNMCQANCWNKLTLVGKMEKKKLNQALRALLCRVEQCSQCLVRADQQDFKYIHNVMWCNCIKEPPPPPQKKFKHMAHQEGKQSNLGSTCLLEGWLMSHTALSLMSLLLPRSMSSLYFTAQFSQAFLL